MTCQHSDYRIGKVICRDGRFHIVARCCACGTNVRGTANWVPQSELPASCDLNTLPVFRDLREDGKRDDQPDLFGSAE
jgi:hypothetical protein